MRQTTTKKDATRAGRSEKAPAAGSTAASNEKAAAMTHVVRGWMVRFRTRDHRTFYSYGAKPIGYSFFLTRRDARQFARECQKHGIGDNGAVAVRGTLIVKAWAR